jgi:hypothetical protein
MHHRAVHGVLQDHNGFGGVVIRVHVAAAGLNDRIPIIGIQLSQRVAPDDSARVIRDRDDVLDHHILGVDIEEIVAVDQALQALGHNLEVGAHRGVLRHVSRRHERASSLLSFDRLRVDSRP